jgi:hypothetical protein
MSSPDKVESFYWEEMMNLELPLPSQCVLGTSAEDMALMANTVVDSMTAILFAETHDKTEAYQKAVRLWHEYCAR